VNQRLHRRLPQPGRVQHRRARLWRQRPGQV